MNISARPTIKMKPLLKNSKNSFLFRAVILKYLAKFDLTNS